MASKQIPDSGISNQKIESDFGSYPTDFIEYYVYDSDDNFIVSKIKKSGAKSDLVELNPGKDLRECGLIAGKYKGRKIRKSNGRVYICNNITR